MYEMKLAKCKFISREGRVEKVQYLYPMTSQPLVLPERAAAHYGAVTTLKKHAVLLYVVDEDSVLERLPQSSLTQACSWNGDKSPSWACGSMWWK